MWSSTQRRAIIDDLIHEAIQGAESCSGTRHAVERLLRHVRATTTLLSHRSDGSRFDTAGIRKFIDGLVAVAAHHRDWLRPVEDWNPIRGSPLPQFASLPQHLFARYPLPDFMTSVWFRGRDAVSPKQQGWYKHIGLGRSIRTVELPLAYSKRMAHHFMQAPAHFSVEMALRWGQIRALGGSEALANSIAATWLGRSFEHEDFWTTVIQFFVNQPRLEISHIGPIIDYLHAQRFVPPAAFIEEGELGPPDPPQRNLTMKGRTWRSLLRHVDDWHRRLGRSPKFALVRWNASGISPFHVVEQGEQDSRVSRVWTIRELQSSAELFREGVAMQHCVARYWRACSTGASSIWSMRVDNNLRRRRVMTIEVDVKRRIICQARERRNARAHGKPREILARWAHQEGLAIVDSV